MPRKKVTSPKTSRPRKSVRKASPDTLRQGDCVEGMRVIKAESVDLIFADPPFNIGYAYDHYDDRKTDAEYLDWSRLWMREVWRILKPGRAFWLAIGDEFVAELKTLAHRELGFEMRNWCVWYYTFGVYCRSKFARSHTHLLYFVKPGAAPFFDDTSIRVPSARQLIYHDQRADSQGRIPDNTWILRPQDFENSFNTENDVWYFPRVCGTFNEREGWHGCQMPERVLGRIIRACSQKDEWVVDPFAGSGTTLAVAKKLGRHSIGFEISPEYWERANERLCRIQCGDPLEGEAPTT
ncbi:MAG: site-specific DNA-methyltransferase [Thermoguttaceae bacterium]|nr:site-specific DNA-methyltransferase [Thermoguttaceae bacterium]